VQTILAPLDRCFCSIRLCAAGQLNLHVIAAGVAVEATVAQVQLLPVASLEVPFRRPLSVIACGSFGIRIEPLSVVVYAYYQLFKCIEYGKC
jgi:hypothetical protein